MINNEKRYENFETGNGYYLASAPRAIAPKLPAGVYELVLDHKTQQVYFKKTKNTHDTLIDLPSEAYTQVVGEIENFVKPDTREKFKNRGFVYKRSSLLYGLPGCHARGTEILMYDGSIKLVEDVVVGDQLMGPDSTPRTVLRLARGREPMVKIIPVKGESFIVNLNHILHLTPSGKVGGGFNHPINIKVSDYLKNTKCFKQRLKLTRTGVTFNTKELPIDPYILGSWLGDGNSGSVAITSMDSEILNYWENYAKTNNLEVNITGLSGKSMSIHLTSGRKRIDGIKRKNEVLTAFHELEIINNKHIPQLYKTSSKEQRLELLAGILDTDGSLDKSGIFDYVSKSERLANDVVFLSRSLGFAAYITEVEKECVNNGVWKTYYRVGISGDLSTIPTKLERKKANKRKQLKSVLRTGFSYEIQEEGDYYGFSLDKDHLYLTSDFTIHHNTGKTCIANRICQTVITMGGVVIQNPDPRLLATVFEQLDYVQPETLILVVFEEMDKLAERHEEALLNLLDGEIQKDNIVYIGTTNYINKVPVRLKRPGRFSSVIEVPFPKAAERDYFLLAKAPDLSDAERKMWVEKTAGLSIDEVTECLRSVLCLGYQLDDIVKRFTPVMSEEPSESEEDSDSIDVEWEKEEAVEALYKKHKQDNGKN